MDDVVAIEVRAGASVFAIVSYYCPPDGRLLNSAMLERYVLKYERVIVAGDLNAKHQFYGSKRTDARGEELFDFVERNNLIVANDPNQMTFQSAGTGHWDLIDYFVVSRQVGARTVECYVGECIGSDHLPVHLTIQLQCKINTVPSKQVRILSKCDWALFGEQLKETTSSLDASTLTSESSIDARCAEIEQSITQAIDLACPKRTVKDYAFRLRPETVNLIKLKRKIRKKSQKSNDPAYRTLYNNISRQVNAAVMAERQKAWQVATASLDETDGRSFWQKFKLLTGVTQNNSHRNVQLPDQTGEPTSDPDNVAGLFADSLQKIHVTHNGPYLCDTTKSEVERHVLVCKGEYRPNFIPEAEEATRIL